MSILIKGGRIITAADDFSGDVLVDGERIALVGSDLPTAGADRVVDARGKYVLPGGIDPHTHLEMPFGGTVTCDDFTSGTISAAFGGTTTLIDFCIQQTGQTLPQALATWEEKIARCPPVIDVGFHIAVTDLGYDGALDDLSAMVQRGIPSFKLFMAYKGALMVDDATLFRAMEVAARSGAVIMVHAENGDVVDVLVKETLRQGHREPIWHARSRPPETEGEATNRAIQLAHLAGCPLYVVHVTCEDAMEPVARARAAGWDVSAETCTQYLFIDESYLARDGFEGAKYVYTPPARPRWHQERLWRALEQDTLSVVSTDHCPFNFEGQKTLGRDDFTKIPNGGPGIEDRLHMLHHFGVGQGRISLNRFVELTSTNAARRFGLYPRKGTIAPGSDADLVVFDPAKRLTLSAARHHSRVDYNLFEGTEVQGGTEVVMVRGTVLVEGDRLVGKPGDGTFLRRSAVGTALRAVAG